MKISYNWLKEYVQVRFKPQLLANALTCAGLAVDTVEQLGNDFIFDFDITSNRPDALSHLGIAREVAAIFATKVNLPTINLPQTKISTEKFASVQIENLSLCPRYSARILRGVKIGPSPKWLVDRLESVGQRSINNVVDATNFTLLELGHPLHAFDLDTLANHQIIVRTAREEETLVTLDGIERKLTPQMLVIADADRPVALAGVMGGANTEISNDTVNILLESAYFVPNQVRHTANNLGIHTEASHRFERGTDYEIIPFALDRCAQLINQLAGGEITYDRTDLYPIPLQQPVTKLRYERIKELTGVDVPFKKVEEILSSLNIQLKLAEDQIWQVVSPSYRIDLQIEEDFVEEVVRIVGYDAIPTTLPKSSSAGSYKAGEEKQRMIRQLLIGQGFLENISFSWTSDEQLKVIGYPNSLSVLNPIDKTESCLRNTLLPGLLNSVAHNFSHRINNLRIFEFGKIFSGSIHSIEESEYLTLVITGNFQYESWDGFHRNESFFSLKAIIEMIFDSLQIDAVKFRVPHTTIPSIYFPGQVAELNINDVFIGWVGRVSLDCAAHYKFKQPVYVAEIQLKDIINKQQIFKQYCPIPKFPSIDRDISALFDVAVSYEEIKQCILALGFSELKEINLRDVFIGKQVPNGKRSLTLSLCYQLDNRTLTDQEVNIQHSKVLLALQDRLSAEIR